MKFNWFKNLKQRLDNFVDSLIMKAIEDEFGTEEPGKPIHKDLLARPPLKITTLPKSEHKTVPHKHITNKELIAAWEKNNNFGDYDSVSVEKKLPLVTIVPKLIAPKKKKPRKKYVRHLGGTLQSEGQALQELDYFCTKKNNKLEKLWLVDYDEETDTCFTYCYKGEPFTFEV